MEKNQSETGRMRFQRARFQTPNSVIFLPHWVLSETELSEFFAAYYCCAKANSPSFSQNSPSLPKDSVNSSFRQRRRDDNINKTRVFWGGGGHWAPGREENRPKTLFFLRNATTIKYWKWKLCCREILLSLRRLLFQESPHETVFCPFPSQELWKSVRVTKPKSRKNKKSAQKVGFPPIPEKALKCAQNTHSLRKKYATSAVLHTIRCPFWN